MVDSCVERLTKALFCVTCSVDVHVDKLMMRERLPTVASDTLAMVLD